TITTTNTYDDYGDWTWRLTNTSTRGGESGLARSTTFTYEEKTGNKLTEEFHLSGVDTPNPITTFYYDDYGNVTDFYDANTTAKANPGIDLNEDPTILPTMHTEYDDATATYPVLLTNGLGHNTYVVADQFNNFDFDYKLTDTADEIWNVIWPALRNNNGKK
ncbi:MAG: hypothetical protein L3J05_05305, partial [Robiginitomaculum sp.]|nr:hypothetical protein [Robiginitomaculum sp.]